MPKRELIAPKGDKRHVRRDTMGRFNESDDAGRSLAAAGHAPHLQTVGAVALA